MRHPVLWVLFLLAAFAVEGVIPTCGNSVVEYDEGEWCDGGDGCVNCMLELADPLCDLARSCGDNANAICEERQSTAKQNSGFPPKALVEGSGRVGDQCMTTARGSDKFQYPQWWRVDFGTERNIMTVEIDFGANTNGWEAPDFGFKIWVTNTDADMDSASTSEQREDDTAPRGTVCDFDGAINTSEVTQVSCAANGRYMFISHKDSGRALALCDVQVFSHSCLTAGEELSCGTGQEPSPCQTCRGCQLCQPGTYSDEIGLDPCLPCPSDGDGPAPYSPEGSVSEFQCYGAAYLDGSSEVVLNGTTFNQAIDSWELKVGYKVSPRTKVKTFFLSKGGEANTESTFTSANFPCRVDHTRTGNSDLTGHLEETACCLQDFRADYVIPTTFRAFSDGLADKLVAANDICDGPQGSAILRDGRHLPLVAEEGAPGNVFVDTDGQPFERDIVMRPVEPGVMMITIPDEVLFQVSRAVPGTRRADETAGFADAREIFIGLFDMLPTGTRVLDSAHQQISVVLTRTQYGYSSPPRVFIARVHTGLAGSFSAFGPQNIDYTFLSFLNARVHQVMAPDSDSSPTGDQRRAFHDDGRATYAAVSFVYDDSLDPSEPGMVVLPGTVQVKYADGEPTEPCSRPADAALNAWSGVVNREGCSPGLGFGVADNYCPQLSIPQNNYAQIHIPLIPDSPQAKASESVEIAFNVNLTDSSVPPRYAVLSVNMVVVTTEFVTWCDSDSAATDLADKVTPRMLIGTETASPPRLVAKSGPDFTFQDSPASTLQDALITLILEFDSTSDATALAVFVEDVVVVHINPGADTTEADLLAEPDRYLPTYTYNPANRDATLHIPPALQEACPEVNRTDSFFGCVHKHVILDEEVSRPDDVMVVGSGGGADFMEKMLGAGTARDSARQLGRNFESYLVNERGFSPANPRKQAVWINPGHIWGGITANADTSLSQDVIVYVLFGVAAGVDGSRRHLLVQADGNGGSEVVVGLKFSPAAPPIADKLIGAVSTWEVTMGLSPEEACITQNSLKFLLGARLEEALHGWSSPLKRVEIAAVRVEGAECGGMRRFGSEARPLKHVGGRRAGATATVDATVELDEGAQMLWIDWEGVEASSDGAVLRAAPREPAEATDEEEEGEEGEEGKKVEGEEGVKEGVEEQGGLPMMMIAAGGGGGAALCVLVFCLYRRCKFGGKDCRELSEVVWKPQNSDHGPRRKTEIEGMLFGVEYQKARDAGPNVRGEAEGFLRQVSLNRSEFATTRSINSGISQASPVSPPMAFGRQESAVGPSTDAAGGNRFVQLLTPESTAKEVPASAARPRTRQTPPVVPKLDVFQVAGDARDTLRQGHRGSVDGITLDQLVVNSAYTPLGGAAGGRSARSSRRTSEMDNFTPRSFDEASQ